MDHKNIKTRHELLIKFLLKLLHWIVSPRTCTKIDYNAVFYKTLLTIICSCFLVNTADRVIRVYDSKEVLACGKDGEPEPIQKLQDLVNKY